MSTQNLIAIQELCKNYNLEITFFSQLSDVGLIEIETIETVAYVHQDTILNLEKILRLHRDLNVNIEALDVVLNLLSKIDELQLEVNQLNNRLRLHESDE
jgi:hypothetical protein